MGIFKYIFEKSNLEPPNSYRPDFESMSELGQISKIFEYIFNANPEISQDCGKTIHRLLNSQTAFKNKSLYHSLRYVFLKKKDLHKFYKFETGVQNSLFCVASMNSDGYVREEALKFLNKSASENTFPFILFRLSDWVPGIRKIAERGIRHQIQQKKPEYLIRHHKILDWLLKVERSDLQQIHHEIIEFIFSKENIPQITQNIEKYGEGDRYFIIRNLIARNKLDSKFFEKILVDKNYLIRLLAIRNIDLIERPEIIKRLLSDKSQKIRHYAINKIPETQLTQFNKALSKLLFDNSAQIRATARSLFLKITGQNFPKKYRVEVANNPKPGSIVGLSEVGESSDLDTLIELLTSDSPKHRAASLYAISNLDFPQAKEQAFALLKDSSNTVKKMCSHIITREKSSKDLIILRSMYEEGTHDTKLIVLRIISVYGGWDIAGDFLKGILASDKRINQAAFALLDAWFTYSIRLGTKQKESDRNYVMEIYKNLNIEELELPYNIEEVINRIPFIFGRE